MSRSRLKKTDADAASEIKNEESALSVTSEDEFSENSQSEESIAMPIH